MSGWKKSDTRRSRWARRPGRHRPQPGNRVDAKRRRRAANRQARRARRR